MLRFFLGSVTDRPSVCSACVFITRTRRISHRRRGQDHFSPEALSSFVTSMNTSVDL